MTKLFKIPGPEVLPTKIKQIIALKKIPQTLIKLLGDRPLCKDDTKFEIEGQIEGQKSRP